MELSTHETDASARADTGAPVDARAARTLEEELLAVAVAGEAGRTASIAVRHWGWDGRGGATLELTGGEAGITRERARQLCERLAAKLARDDHPPTPLLDQALVLAAGMAPTTAQALARRLADEHLTAQPFEPDGLLTAAAVLRHEPTFSLAVVKGVRCVLPDPPDPATDTSAVITAIVETSRALVRRAGAARIAQVTGRVAASLGVWVDDELVTAVVSEPDDFVWLERRTGWFYLPGVCKNAVVSRVLKVLSVAGRIEVADLHAGIRRDERMREFVMPEYILAELCERIPNVIVQGTTIAPRTPIAVDDALEQTELTLVQVLRAHGGALERHELETLCLARGMKLSSFNNRITYSPIIEERPHNMYGLREAGGAAGERRSRSGRAASARDDDEPPRPGELDHFRQTRGR